MQNPTFSSASMTDILTTQKNGVIAINNLNNTVSAIQTSMDGYLGTVTVTVPKNTSLLVRTGTGMVASSITLVAGGSDSFIYDAVAVSLADTANKTNAIAVIPKAINTTSGNYVHHAYYTSGLVIITDATQVVSVTYSITS